MKRPDQHSIILSMADCFVQGRKAVYCSSELTTGIRLYTACLNNSTTDRYQLTDKLGKEWLRDNVFVLNEREANEFASHIQRKLNRTTISPACLFVPEWGQHDYLSFWETLIKTRICEVWFNENWQYSNGCTFEFSAALACGLPIFDHNGTPLVKEQGLELIGKAIEYLNVRGIKTEKLREHAGLPETHTYSEAGQ
jgi:hypothetical protein